MPKIMKENIVHLTEECRMELHCDGHTAYVEYRITDNALDITHTMVPKELGGRGIASMLVEAAYDYAHTMGYARQATCAYATAWLKKRGFLRED